jgi:hypothetical protein
MQRRASAGAAAFAAIGTFLLAWHLAPGPASDPMRWVLSGVFALAGLVLMFQAIQGAERRPSPWSSPLGRVLWAVRPRSWMIAWAVVFALAAIWGTPHILFEYPPRTRAACHYVGLNGIAMVPLNGGTLNGCRLGTLL